MSLDAGSSDVRLAEALAAVSLAVDLGMAQPFEQGLRTCLLATSLARTVGIAEHDARRVYHLALLRHVGCTAESDMVATFLGDEIGFRAGAMALDWSSATTMLRYMVRHVGVGDSPLRRVRRVGHALAKGNEFMSSVTAVCESGEMLARRIGVDADTCTALWHVFERWDGKGIPGLVGGNDIASPARFVAVAEVAEVISRQRGAEAAIELVRSRSGTAFDPVIADAFVADAHRLLALVEGESVWDEVIAGEPGDQRVLSQEQLDDVLTAVADFADVKSRFTVGHSRGVADVAESAGRAAGISPVDTTTLRRAALVHDVGRVGISASIWSKPGPLTRDEWEKVRLHPYYTERAMSRPAKLATLGRLASLDHERTDASGYHRGSPADSVALPGRLLAAADAFHALKEPRPHRPAYGKDAAADILRDEVRAGRLDSAAVDAVIAGSGGTHRRATHVAGLTAREVEVLRLAARGSSMREIAELLVVSPKTVDAHLQHIYTKIGVTTRAGATLFALQNGLAEPSEDREITR